MKIKPNREALKELASLNIDSGFVQRYGNQIFAYDGDVTDEFKAMSESLASSVADTIAELKIIQENIPVINGK